MLDKKKNYHYQYKFLFINVPGKLISDDSFSLKFDLNIVSNTGDHMDNIALLQYSLRLSTINMTSHITVGLEKSIKSIFIYFISVIVIFYV